MYNEQNYHNDAHILKRPPCAPMGPDPTLPIAIALMGAGGRQHCCPESFHLIF
jgi:hypothetical protein